MKSTKTSIVLYSLSILLIILGSIQLFQSISYILDSLDQKVVTWGSDFATIISYISQACIATYSFAIIFYILGKGYNLLLTKINKEAE